MATTDFPSAELWHVVFRRNNYVRSLAMFNNEKTANIWLSCMRDDRRHSEGVLEVMLESAFLALKKKNVKE